MFLSVILTIVIGFWLLGIIGRLLLRFWVGRMQRRMQQGGGGAGGGAFNYGPFKGFYTSYGSAGTSAQSKDKRKEGEVTVETTGQTKSHNHKDIGDYVDFEEVK